jgi:hypothetical protein
VCRLLISVPSSYRNLSADYAAALPCCLRKTVYDIQWLSFFSEPCTSGFLSGAGIVTRYWLQGAGFEPQSGKVIFFSVYSSRPAQRSTQTPVKWVLGHFPVGKATGKRSWPPSPHLTPKHEWVYNSAFPSVPHWHVTGRTSPPLLYLYYCR